MNPEALAQGITSESISAMLNHWQPFYDKMNTINAMADEKAKPLAAAKLMIQYKVLPTA